MRVRCAAGRCGDVAAGLDDPVERGAIDNQVLDDGECRGAPWLDDDRVAIFERRMCNWQVVVCSGPCAWPLIIRPQVPQMPSRQSWSKATGSSPRRMSSSLRTSSISRKDISGADLST